MPERITPDTLAERICRRLELPTIDNAELIAEMLREAFRDLTDIAMANTKAVCLVIAEEEAERCHAVGATTAHQTALLIAGRIRKEVAAQYGAYSGPRTHSEQK